MKILFVASGNLDKGMSPIVRNQGESLEQAGLTLSYYPIIGKGLRGYLKSVSGLRKHLQYNQYEIIHAHYGLCGIVSLLARRKEKLIVSFMGDDLLGTNRSDGSVTFSSRLAIIINIILSKLFYDFSIVKSSKMSERLKKNKSTIIPNGVDLSKFFPINLSDARNIIGTKNSCKIVLFVSNAFRTEKNYKLAEESVLLLDSNVNLLTVSGIDHPELNKHYNSAEVLLLTSYHEGSPNVIKEAMACNRPIVSTDVGDVKWVLGNTEGCYIATFDPQDIAQKLKKAIYYAETCHYTKGRERILELGLDSESIAGRIAKVYKEVLRKS